MTTRTFYGTPTESYRAFWLEHCLPLHAARLPGANSGSASILERRNREHPELQRLRDFGPAWAWWSVPKDEREQWWALDRQAE